MAVLRFLLPLLVLLFPAACRARNCTDASGQNPGPCGPGREQCGPAFPKALSPSFHLRDQQGCGENDPNSPVFDPVHGVIHHFYQIHVSIGNGGPNYGHFVSKDFINWAPLPTAIWNGVDSSTTPFKATMYDTRGIWSGSAQVFDGAGPGGKGPGIVTIYPGSARNRIIPRAAQAMSWHRPSQQTTVAISC